MSLATIFQLYRFLLVEEVSVLGENHQPVKVTDKLDRVKLYRVHLRIQTHNFSGDRH